MGSKNNYVSFFIALIMANIWPIKNLSKPKVAQLGHSQMRRHPAMFSSLPLSLPFSLFGFSFSSQSFN